MDNLDSWLYIVIMIIAGISGLLSSGKKKKRPEEILRQSEMNKTPEDHEWETTSPLKMSVYTPLFKEGERTIVHQQAEEKPTQENQLAVSEENFRDMDELKKAIIYSEILNRKY
jgi:hypothetical protein